MAIPAQNPLTSPVDEKQYSFDDEHAASVEDGNSSGLVTAKSRGVIEMEQLEERLDKKYLALIYGGFTLLAYCLSVNQYTSATFLSTAVSVEWGMHSLSATINTIAGVFQAMSQPPIAKFADVFGRVNAYIACVVLYVVGYIIVSAAPNIVAYAVGNSIYILGITGLFLLQNIIISDISSLRNRYFWTTFANILGSINVWVAGDIASSLLKNGEAYYLWRWGFGMFCILTPVLALPIILTLWAGSRPDKQRRQELRAQRTKLTAAKFKTGFISLFWQLDFIGLFLFVVGFGLLYVTVTLASSATARWSDPHSIAMLVVGGLTIIAFGVYERFYAPHPLLPLRLFKKKPVIGCLLIAVFHPMAGGIASGYLYTFFLVAGGQSIKAATRLTSLPSFSATFIGLALSAYVSYARRIKWVIVAGLGIQALAFGLMIRFRTSTNSIGELAVVQLLKGFGIGTTTFPLQTVIQASVPHEQLGAITAGYLVVFYLASSAGYAAGGGMWTSLVPKRIFKYMGNDTLADSAYTDPFTFSLEWPMDTQPRLAVARAQDEAQRIMVITGTVLAILAFLSAFLIDNILLPDTQAMAEVEAEAEQDARARGEKIVKPTAHVAETPPNVPTLAQ